MNGMKVFLLLVMLGLVASSATMSALVGGIRTWQVTMALCSVTWFGILLGRASIRGAGREEVLAAGVGFTLLALAAPNAVVSGVLAVLALRLLVRGWQLPANTQAPHRPD